MNKKTTEQIFEENWKHLICNDDGSINLEQLKKELADFSYVMREVPKVYSHITGNLLSKIMYKARVVIDAADRHYKDFYTPEQD